MFDEQDCICSGLIVTLRDHMEGKPDRRSLLFSAILLIAGLAVSVVAQQFHPEGGATPNDVFTSYADATNWTLVHEAQFAGSALFIFGLLALYSALSITAGIRRVVNRFAAASAVAALALNGVLYAVDGVGLKQAVDAWVSAPASEQAALFAVVQGIRGVEWGMRSYIDFAYGLTFVLYGIVIASTTRIPRLIGYIMGLSGLAYIAQGYGYGTGYTSLSQFAPFIPSNNAIGAPVLVWTIWLLISAYRMRESVRTT